MGMGGQLPAHSMKPRMGQLRMKTGKIVEVLGYLKHFPAEGFLIALFFHRAPDNQAAWCVTDPVTGIALNGGGQGYPSLFVAICMVESFIREKGYESVNNKLREALEKYGPLPKKESAHVPV